MGFRGAAGLGGRSNDDDRPSPSLELAGAKDKDVAIHVGSERLWKGGN